MERSVGLLIRSVLEKSGILLMQHLGFSGDEIIITGDSIVKTCRTNQDRFALNAAKQAAFSNPFISAVPIIDQGSIDGYSWIKMPYLDCDNAMLWLSKANAHSIILFIERIANYLSHLLDKRNIHPFDYSAWTNKIDALSSQLTDTTILPILTRLRTTKFHNGLYYGNYHGDLTLTNLLIFNDGSNLTIDAIDFLDCFIHSPINDFVKLRQDTRHLWTFNLLQDHSFDANKVCIALNHIDSKIAKIIEADIILKEYYLPFQILNLIRIIPYSRDANITAYLVREIIKLSGN